MAARTAKIAIEPCAGFGETRALVVLGEPGLEGGRFKDDKLALHPAMADAAKLGASQIVDAGFVGLEPERGRLTGQQVLLDAKLGQIQRMDHVLAGEDHPHRLAGGHGEPIDLALAAGMLELPHPLQADAIDLTRIGRRVMQLAEQDRRPDEEGEREQEGDDHPAPFDPAGPMMRLFAVGLAEAAIAPGEPEQSETDRRGEQHHQREEADSERVDLFGVDRNRFRPEGDAARLQEVDHGRLLSAKST